MYSLQAKIERGCIERLRAYQQPPPLVGTVMVMVMVLLGRKEFASYVQKTSSEKQQDNSTTYDDSASRISSAKSRKPKESKSMAGKIRFCANVS